MPLDIVNALKQSNSSKKAGVNSKFYATCQIQSGDFQLEITGVGKVEVPLTQATIDKLLKIASPAQFGLREKTLTDKNVRDTSEISGDNLRIVYDELKFNKTLEQLRKDLGLPDNTKISAHLHNMLIYGPGQFFKLHQDSEKLPGMVASLVVTLPFPHIGGDLVINHGKQKYTFSTEDIFPQDIKCIAFYADCQHEVKNIKQGYRVTLTYNLVLEVGEAENSEPLNTKLVEALDHYFKGSLDDNTPGKFAFLLDHSYTEHSVNWDLLKGIDRDNALALKVAAKKIGLVPHLALVDIHESWTTIGNECHYEAAYSQKIHF